MKQLLEMNDPLYGFASPHYVYSYDQVPLGLAAFTDQTIDKRGLSRYVSIVLDEHEVQDSTTKNGDDKYSATLNLCCHKSIRDNKFNIPNPKPRIVFHETSFLLSNSR